MKWGNLEHWLAQEEINLLPANAVSMYVADFTQW
jgi:hypothetical protein